MILNNKRQAPEKIYSDLAFTAIAKNYKRKQKCKECSMKYICDGLTKQYYDRFSDLELKPYCGELIKDPTYYIKKQYKIID